MERQEKTIFHKVPVTELCFLTKYSKEIFQLFALEGLWLMIVELSVAESFEFWLERFRTAVRRSRFDLRRNR